MKKGHFGLFGKKGRGPDPQDPPVVACLILSYDFPQMSGKRTPSRNVTVLRTGLTCFREFFLQLLAYPHL